MGRWKLYLDVFFGVFGSVHEALNLKERKCSQPLMFQHDHTIDPPSKSPDNQLEALLIFTAFIKRENVS